MDQSLRLSLAYIQEIYATINESANLKGVWGAVLAPYRQFPSVSREDWINLEKFNTSPSYLSVTTDDDDMATFDLIK